MKKIISLVCAFAVSLGAISFFAPSGAAEDYSDALTAAAESTVVIDRSTMTLSTHLRHPHGVRASGGVHERSFED